MLSSVAAVTSVQPGSTGNFTRFAVQRNHPHTGIGSDFIAAVGERGTEAENGAVSKLILEPFFDVDLSLCFCGVELVGNSRILYSYQSRKVKADPRTIYVYEIKAKAV